MDATLLGSSLAGTLSAIGQQSLYQSIEVACEDMLEAARRDDWATVDELRAACANLIDSIRNPDSQRPQPAVDRKETFRILRRIVVLDGQLRQLAQPWVRNLDTLLESRETASIIR